MGDPGSAAKRVGVGELWLGPPSCVQMDVGARASPLWATEEVVQEDGRPCAAAEACARL